MKVKVLLRCKEDFWNYKKDDHDILLFEREYSDEYYLGYMMGEWEIVSVETLEQKKEKT